MSSKRRVRSSPERLSDDQRQLITHAIADPRRFTILQQISRESSLACSCLEVHAAISPATISHHLKELQAAGLIDVAREGRSALLTFRRDTWNAFVQQLAEL